MIQQQANMPTGKTYMGVNPNGNPSIDVPPATKVSQKDQIISELKINYDTLDREREFYFGKLRDIEEML